MRQIHRMHVGRPSPYNRFVRPGWSTIYESLGSVVTVVVSASVAPCACTARSGGPEPDQAGAPSRYVVLRGKWACCLLLRTGPACTDQRHRLATCGDVLPRRADHGAFEGLSRRISAAVLFIVLGFPTSQVPRWMALHLPATIILQTTYALLFRAAQRRGIRPPISRESIITSCPSSRNIFSCAPTSASRVTLGAAVIPKAKPKCRESLNRNWPCVD